MADFLLELRSEEIPARMQAGARADLEKLFRKEMQAAGVLRQAQDERVEITVWSTPRRLALIAKGLPAATEAVREETKGPRSNAPEQALEGFLRKTGLTKDQLTERDGVFFAVVEKPGRPVKDVLAEAIPAIVRAFPWPKSQRWGAASISTESLRWVRPLSGVVAILGEELVECEIEGIRSGFATKGHRFHHPGEITIGGAEDYKEKLRACHVLVDHAEREEIVREKARHAAHEAGLVLVEDEGLVVENAGLTEWPVPLLGRFDESYLEVPPEVIQLTARTNQKYFICRTPQGELANAFVCTANIVALDGGEAIVAGNRKVLAARLSDARFFWQQDRKTTLAEQAKKLERITFHEKLGTVADKVDRVAKLARWLCEEGIVTPVSTVTPALRLADKSAAQDKLPFGQAGVSGGSVQTPGMPASAGMTKEELADLAEQAARLCKADLVTEMVGEFPELQGLMGGYYARAEGLPDAVADAIRDHYKPVGQGDEVPTAPVTVAVSLADKLDSLFAFFAIGEVPSGSRDPYALRRSALGAISLILTNNLRFSFIAAMQFGIPNVGKAMARVHSTKEIAAREVVADVTLLAGEQISSLLHPYSDSEDLDWENNPILKEVASKVQEAPQKIADFMTDRLKVQQKEAGVRHDLIDAVFALGGEDDLVRLLARVHALQAFVGTEDGANLLTGYKRAANILKKEEFDTSSVTPAKAGVSGGSVQTLEMPASAGMTAYTPEPAEKTLVDALEVAGPKAAAAVESEDFGAAMAALATLRGPIDAFFDSVTVNDADAEKRRTRLALLDRFRVAVHNVADFSRIEG